jgi:hypothetical protein
MAQQDHHEAPSQHYHVVVVFMPQLVAFRTSYSAALLLCLVTGWKHSELAKAENFFQEMLWITASAH